MDEFMRDHCMGWRPPMKLRKIRHTDASIAQCLAIRTADIEAGRKRMVARGLHQYAKPGELCGCGCEQTGKLDSFNCANCGVYVRFCPNCRTIVCVPTTCSHHHEGDKAGTRG